MYAFYLWCVSRHANIHSNLFDFQYTSGIENYAIFHCIEIAVTGKKKSNLFELCDENSDNPKFKFTISLIRYDKLTNEQKDHPQNVYYYSSKQTNQLSWHFGDGIDLGKDEGNASDYRDDLDAL